MTETEIKRMLQEGIVSLDYCKQDGQLNQRKGTRNLALIPEPFHPNGKGKESDSEAIAYFDLCKGAWRSFKLDCLQEATLTLKIERVFRYKWVTLELKELTQAMVNETAYHILAQEEQITSLTLKKALRAEGFYAIQAEVSQILEQVPKLNFEVKYHHRLYYLNSEE